MRRRLNRTPVDVVVLSRDSSPLEPRVAHSIRSQLGVDVVLHRVIGVPSATDRNRVATIARARNASKSKGASPWFMFVDDDVVIPQDCIQRLLAGLSKNSRMGAMAADYSHAHGDDDALQHHVAMGATLFRRSAIDSIEFRESPGCCECQCCCIDLRKQSWGIRYLPGLKARHLKHIRSSNYERDDRPVDRSSLKHCEANRNVILTAFDHRHCEKFQNRFLSTLRAVGNDEHVVAIASGLSTSQVDSLRGHENLSVVESEGTGLHIAAGRFFGFSKVLNQTPSTCRVAFWDAGDVVFQRRLTELWRRIDRTPEKVAVTAEPWTNFTRQVRRNWIQRTYSQFKQGQMLRVMRQKPVLNGGFAAGYVDVLRRFVDGVLENILSPSFRGSGGFSQLEMMEHCYRTNCYSLVNEDWNYCLIGRPAHDTIFASDGKIRRSTGELISVVHGTGGTLD